MKILIVEDNQADADLIKEEFFAQLPDYKLTIASTGKLGLKLFGEENYDCVLLDFQLPDMNGIKIMQDILCLKPEQLVIMVTGRGEPELAVQALQAGAFDYVPKRVNYYHYLPQIVKKNITEFLESKNILGVLPKKLIRILIVEDEIEDLEFINNVLRNSRLNFKSNAFGSGEDALEELKKNPNYDIILADLVLPQMDALELIKEIKSLNINIPVICISGRGSEETAVTALKLGVSNYIVKRVGYTSLLPAAIENALLSFNLAEKNKVLQKELVRAKENLEEKVKQRTIELNKEIELRKENEEKFYSLFRNATIGIYRTTQEGKILLANPALLKMLGYNSLEEIQLRNLEEEGYEPEYPRAKFKEQIEKYGFVRGLESKWHRKDGSILYVEESAHTIRDEKGKTLYYDGIVEDITVRVEAQAKVISNEKLLQSVLDYSEAVIYIKDLDYRYVTINKTFEKLFNQKGEDSKGKTDFDYFPKEIAQKFRDVDQQVFTKKAPISIEEIVPLSDGIHTYISEKFPLFDENGKLYALCGISTDITERKKMEETLIEAKKAAEESDQLKSDFLNQISHEIRTPLHIIISCDQLIRDSLIEKVEKADMQFFDMIESATKRIMRTIELILNMSELRRGTYKPAMVKLNMRIDVLKKIEMDYELFAKEKGLDFTVIYNTELLNIIGDEYSITQILINIIDNAVKYTLEGKVDVEVNRTDQNKLEVKVRDTGIGMSEEFLPKLFQAFTQEEQGFSRSFEGNGLGMALVEKYCEINNILITVESKKNEGTTVKLIFNSEE